jgi:hypothetical protein
VVARCVTARDMDAAREVVRLRRGHRLGCAGVVGAHRRAASWSVVSSAACNCFVRRKKEQLAGPQIDLVPSSADGKNKKFVRFLTRENRDGG